jgi:hypothetical protein
MNIDINSINGNEIIDYLNKISMNDELDDISIERNSFVFDTQYIKDDKYNLNFIASYNNWGTIQNINDNTLHITSDKLWFSLNESFDCDETDRILSKVLKIWIENHTFDTNLEEKFNNILEDVYQILPEISIENTERLIEVINMLTKAKTYMKLSKII